MRIGGEKCGGSESHYVGAQSHTLDIAHKRVTFVYELQLIQGREQRRRAGRRAGGQKRKDHMKHAHLSICRTIRALAEVSFGVGGVVSNWSNIYLEMDNSSLISSVGRAHDC